MQQIVSDGYSYSHLMGLFLGDGRLQATGHGHRLLLRLDAARPDLVDDAASSIALLTMGDPVERRLRPGRSSVVLDSAWIGWATLLPETGPSREGERPIVLAPWQQAIVDREPEAFLRGLIASDGCRVINRFRTTLPSGRVAEYAYPRYFLSNPSTDIRGLFCAACERIGVHWTQSNAGSISVAHRRSVALLDTFVGPEV